MESSSSWAEGISGFKSEEIGGDQCQGRRGSTLGGS